MKLYFFFLLLLRFYREEEEKKNHFLRFEFRFFRDPVKVEVVNRDYHKRGEQNLINLKRKFVGEGKKMFRTK